MADELTSNPEGAPAPAELVPTPEVTAEPELGEQPEGQATPDDLEEAEYEGRKHHVPKGWKDALLRHGDYTRKTQEAAELRRAVEAEKAQVAEQAQTFQRHAKEVGQIYGLNAQIEPYEKLGPEGWQRYSQNNPVEAQSAWFQYQALKDQREALVRTVTAQEQKWHVEAQREHAKRVEEGRKAIAAKIPGWNDDLGSKLKEHALSRGFTAQQWESVTDPLAVEVLHDAYLYRQLLARQRTAQATPQPVPQQPPVGGQRSPATDLRTLAKSEDNSAYAKARSKQWSRRQAS